jgi:hypothetical protein
VGRGGLEPPTSAVIGPERWASKSGRPSVRRGVIRRDRNRVALQPHTKGHDRGRVSGDDAHWLARISNEWALTVRVEDEQAWIAASCTDFSLQ